MDKGGGEAPPAFLSFPLFLGKRPFPFEARGEPRNSFNGRGEGLKRRAYQSCSRWLPRSCLGSSPPRLAYETVVKNTSGSFLEGNGKRPPPGTVFRLSPQAEYRVPPPLVNPM